jgi:nicotinamidase/pyrazinamidase
MTTPKVQIASFDVDAQKGFTPLCPKELPVAGGDEIVDSLNFMASLASLRVGSKDSHAPNADWIVGTAEEMLQPTGMVNADVTWLPHCIVGTPGFELLDGLPDEIDYGYFVWKGIEKDLHPYGACYHDIQEKQSTGVIEVLRASKISKVLVGGLALDFCVKTTALQLAKAGFDVVVYLPACREISKEKVIEAMAEMINAGVVLARDEIELKVLAFDTEDGQEPI